MSSPQQEGNDFQNSLFGCFGDFRLCLMTFVAPCYVIGKNAEYLGEDCLLIGSLTALGLFYGAVIRWRLRQEKGLKGSMLMDVVLSQCLPCCTAIQEAKEIGWYDKMKKEKAENNNAAAPAAEKNLEEQDINRT